MTDLFISFLNMSITGAYVILAVVLLRFSLKSMPKKYSYLLWSVVGFRLCCPVSFKSVVSMFNLRPFDMSVAQSSSGASLDYVKDATEKISVGIPTMNSVIAETTATPVYQENVNWLLVLVTAIWVFGIAVLFAYALFSFLKLNKALSTAIKIENGIYKSEKITSPFIIGIIKPKIYIPSNVVDDYLEYVIAHEKHHIKRFDNGIKLISFILLVLHWYNPLCWLAFYLVNKDMEMSCDEYVLSKNNGIKKDYSSALLSFATDKSFPAPSPVFFSESGVKVRIKNVLKYKKPRKIFSIIAIVLSAVLLVACAANPINAVDESNFESITTSDDGYIVGTPIGVNLLSSTIGDPDAFKKINVDKNYLEISYTNGDSELYRFKESKPANVEKIEGLTYVSAEEDALVSGYTIKNVYPFKDAKDISIRIYKGDSEEYSVFFKSGKPFAFATHYSIFRLEAPNLDDEITKGVLELTNSSKYIAEHHKLLAVVDGNEKGSDKDKYETVYAFATVSSFEYSDKAITEITSNQNAVVQLVFEKGDNKLKYQSGEILSNGDDKDLPVLIKDDVAYLALPKNELHLRQGAYEKAIAKYKMDTRSTIQLAFSKLNKLPIEEVKDNQSYELLLYLNNFTFDYLCERFNSNDFDEHLASIYRLVLEDLLKADYEDLKININFDGKQYYDAVYEHYLNELVELGSTDLELYSPKGYRMLLNGGDIFPYDSKYEFVFNKYWYTVTEDEGETIVCCHKFEKNGVIDLSVYELKDGIWSVSCEQHSFSFDENDTIVYEWASGVYSKGFVQVDTKNQTIAEYERSTMSSKLKVLVQYYPAYEDALDTAKSILSKTEK